MLDSPDLESLFVRLYLDRHIMARLATDLRGRGFDVLRTEEAGNDTATDDEQLAFSTAANRAILTFNTRDFANLHEQWRAASRPHTGIVVSRQLSSSEYGTLLNRMLRLLNEISAEEMASNLVHLERFK
jgi:predicted nuclease of predicted toxin-antitoxin system